ncbi:CNP1-like family protein [Neisseria iguanae]|uniref:Cryptic protein cnp1 n=1 Tax=Neisseria iguanae TaxID=90242 RepID=A0A2P7U2D8_9NEIS|nr:CNP1-like family protein [Neisseria iguanae]PSJ81101.1 cryptic protein cnp1 [Neisseria iguanae]
MRRISLLVTALATTSAFALPGSDKDTLVNSRYQESAEEKTAREFKEAEAGLPALPDTKSGDWFDIYISETYAKRPKILLSSLQIMPSPDTSIRYILNTQSSQGYDNLTAEGIFCARSSFNYAGNKHSSYKVFGYGDPVNNRWIKPRNADWKPMGGAISRNDELRSVIFNAFCVDGAPNTVEDLIERLQQRAGRHKPSMTDNGK